MPLPTLTALKSSHRQEETPVKPAALPPQLPAKTVTKAPHDAQDFAEQHAPAAPVSSQANMSLGAGADGVETEFQVPLDPGGSLSSLSAVGAQPASHDASHQHGDADMDPELIAYDTSTGMVSRLDHNVCPSRTCLRRFAAIYPSAEIVIETASGEDGVCAQQFVFKDVDAESLQLFMLVGINDIMFRAIKTDTRHHWKMETEQLNSSATAPSDIFSERLMYQKEVDTDSLLGCVRIKRKRADRDELHTLCSLPSCAGTDSDSVPGAHTDGCDVTASRLPVPDNLAASMIAIYWDLLMEPTNVLLGAAFASTLLKVKEAVHIAQSVGESEAPEWAVLVALSIIPEKCFPPPEQGPILISEDLRVLMNKAHDIYVARNPAPSSHVSAASCASRSQSRPAAAQPQAAAIVLEAAMSELQAQVAFQSDPPFILTSPHDDIQSMEAAPLSGSPFSGEPACCCL